MAKDIACHLSPLMLYSLKAFAALPLITLSLHLPVAKPPSYTPNKPGGGASSPFYKIDIKPVAKIVAPDYELLTPLEPIYVNKLRPYGTYANNYAAGNCTYGVASRLPIPDSWGNANQWVYSASLAGYSVSDTPQAGSIAQTSGDSYLGHVAIVEAVNPDGSFLIWEMNGMYGLGTTDTRLTTTSEFPNFIIV